MTTDTHSTLIMTEQRLTISRLIRWVNRESSDGLTQHHITKTMSQGVLCHQNLPSILA